MFGGDGIFSTGAGVFLFGPSSRHGY